MTNQEKKVLKHILETVELMDSKVAFLSQVIESSMYGTRKKLREILDDCDIPSLSGDRLESIDKLKE
tara:strand:+ start:3145 stop:3345 length:201 start_codon:yes stop_codon:yes gene_type:complete